MSAAQSMKKLRRKRKKLGLCTRCGQNKKNKGNTMCIICLDYQKQKNKEIQEKKNKVNYRVRTLRKWKVTNLKLFLYMFENKIYCKDISKKVGVSTRQVNRWLYEDAIANKENREKLKKICGKDIFLSWR